MNHFNKKGRNNVKAKHKQKRDSRRDRAAEKQAKSLPAATPSAAASVSDALEDAQAQGATMLPPSRPLLVPRAKMERLAVSGRRTGKHKRKLLRKWRKSQIEAAVESGAVSMEDIVMYAADTAAGKRRKHPQEQRQGGGADAGTAPDGSSAMGRSGGPTPMAMGFRVKPSKKVRLRLKRRTGAGGGPAAQGDLMVE